jgi:hypothetical protein
LNYYTQVIIGRKFNDVFTLQLSPNLTASQLCGEADDDNQIWATGAGGKVKLSRRVSLTFDYYFVFNPDQNKG